ncbi:ABC transporter permease [Nesterenkonia suensis]
MTMAHPTDVTAAPKAPKGRNIRGVLALTGAAVIVILAVFAPWLSPADPTQQSMEHRFAPIGAEGYLLGADSFGRDILSRLIHGARVEMITALSATLIAMVAGVTLGLLGGYFGGLTRGVTMRAMDVVLTIPPLMLALFAVTLYGAGMVTLIGALAILFTPAFARITYGQVLSIREREYVDAARLFGAPVPVILVRVILPNVSAPILVQFTLTIANAILLESGLSYLGLGIVPPTPSWGAMVAEGQRYLGAEPQALLVPAAAIVISILIFTQLGDAMRRWLDPQERKRR